MKKSKIIKYWIYLLGILVAVMGQERIVSASGTMNQEYAFQVLDIVNQERKNEGLSELTMDKELLATAELRAEEITQSFSHTRPDGTSCFTAFTRGGYRGENIAYGYASPAAVMEDWMDSPGHKANILNKNYNSIGVGCYYYDGAYYWVQCFSSEDAEEAERPAGSNEGNSSDTGGNTDNDKNDISEENLNNGANQNTGGKNVTPKVSRVSRVKLIAAKKKLSLVWKKQKNIAGYQIQIATSKQFKSSQRTTYTVKKASTTKKTITKFRGKKLKAKKRYYVRIRAYAYGSRNGKKMAVYGKWTTVNKKTK